MIVTHVVRLFHVIGTPFLGGLKLKSIISQTLLASIKAALDDIDW